MRRFRPLLVVVLVAGGLAVAAGDAVALSPALVDCNAHNKLTRHYTVSQLRTALATMPSDMREYTDCYQTIQDQLFAQVGHTVKGSKGSDSAGSGGSSFPVVLVVVLVVIVLGGGGLAWVSWRRRGPGGPGGGGMPPPAAA